MQQYSQASVSEPAVMSLLGSIVLPVPIQINDVTTVVWEQASLTAMGASAATSALQGASQLTNKIGALATKILGLNNAAGGALGGAASILGYETGMAANPYLIMLFKTQNFKNHTLQWILAPNNQNDTNALQNIISILKNGMLPTGGAAILGYPLLVQPVLSMGNFTYQFKPCAIRALSVNWSGAGMPSFHDDTSPSVVYIQMDLTETQLWFQGDVQQGGQV